ncbi:hypothetical protein ACRALDRAFT_211681 [Sodiomyces alcalophilus JCM 7366]|uniref:uncharacterized protein n=1 Tax=Sodiomyces alcalophilus JCM 7366 TaxID=591952 RepID=UPI0039B45BA2
MTGQTEKAWNFMLSCTSDLDLVVGNLEKACASSPTLNREAHLSPSQLRYNMIPSPSINEILAEISSAQNARFKATAGPFKGGSNIIYGIQSDRGSRWCLRIPRDVDAGGLAARGARLLRRLKQQQPTLQVPAVIYTSERYTVLEYVDGNALGSWNTRLLTRERRLVLLDHLASFLFSLWTLDIPPVDALGQLNFPTSERRITYREWLLKEVDRGLRRTLQGSSSWGNPTHYLYRRSKIDELIPYPDNGRPVVKHGDLNAWNIIVSKLTPAPSAIQHPLFLADIPGWRNDNVPEDMTFEEDRAYLEHAIGMLDARLGSPHRIEYLLRTSFERQFLELSLHNRRINEQYIKRRFDPRKWSRKLALDQLDDFLSGHESMQSLPAVVELRNNLNQNTEFSCSSALGTTGTHAWSGSAIEVARVRMKLAASPTGPSTIIHNQLTQPSTRLSENLMKHDPKI